jgi:hypothetical protein
MYRPESKREKESEKKKKVQTNSTTTFIIANTWEEFYIVHIITIHTYCWYHLWNKN